MATHNELGILGEQLALEYLVEKGYKVLEKNWRYLKAEIDIIAQKDNTLIIVEVKTRTSTFFGNPEDFVTKTKVKRTFRLKPLFKQQFGSLKNPDNVIFIINSTSAPYNAVFNFSAKGRNRPILQVFFRYGNHIAMSQEEYRF